MSCNNECEKKELELELELAIRCGISESTAVNIDRQQCTYQDNGGNLLSFGRKHFEFPRGVQLLV